MPVLPERRACAPLHVCGLLRGPCLACFACCSAVPAHAQAAAGRGRCGRRLCRCPRGTRGRWSWCARPLTRATTHRWVAGGLSAAAALMLGLEGGCLSPAADEDVHAFVFECIALLLLCDLAAAGGRGGDLEPARRQLQLLAPRGRDGRVNAAASNRRHMHGGLVMPVLHSAGREAPPYLSMTAN